MKKLIIAILFFVILFPIYAEFTRDENAEQFFAECYPEFHSEIYQNIGVLLLVVETDDFNDFIGQAGCVIEGIYQLCVYYNQTTLLETYRGLGFNDLLIQLYYRGGFYEMYLPADLILHIYSFPTFEERATYAVYYLIQYFQLLEEQMGEVCF